jgi:ATP-binding cassette, subfamily C, bacterial LapB
VDTLVSLEARTDPMPPRKRPATWTEAVWLERLETAVGAERRAASPVAAALPAMLIALGWLGTARSLAGLVPAPDEALTFEHVERLLPAIGFRARCVPASGTAADTRQLRAGSLAQKRDGAVGVYLGHSDGKDVWLVDGHQRDLPIAKGDTILAVVPDIDFRPVDEPRRNWFRGLFEKMRNELFALFGMSLVVNILALTVSLYTLVVYGHVIPSGTTTTIWGIALVAVVAIVGGWALKLGRQIVFSRLGSWAGIRIGSASMRKMLALPLETSTRLGVQNNIVRMRSFENARTFLSGAGSLNLIDYPFVVIFVITIAAMGGWLVLVPILALLTYAALAFPTSDYVASKSNAAGVAAGKLEEYAVSALLGINAFNQAGADNQWLVRFADLARASAGRNREYAIAVARAQTIGQGLGLVTVLATLCTGIMLVLNGTMHPAGLVAAMMLIWRITVPAQQAFGSLVRLRQISASVAELDDLMATAGERATAEFSSPVGLEKPELIVDRVYYRPDADFDAALNGVSFTVPPGARVAIVGPSAGGKSSLLECLAGLRRPQAGRVLVAGRDIRQFDTTEYRAWLGYVPQKVPALPLTVRDYLRLRTPTLQDDLALAAFEKVIGPDWKQLPVFDRRRRQLGGQTQRHVDGENAALAAQPPPKAPPGAGSKPRHFVLDRMLDPFTDDHEELQFRQIVAFVAATLGEPALLLIDGDGVGGTLGWEPRILRYLDSLRGSTTVIWAPYTTEHIQTCDQIVILDRGSVLHVGPAAGRPALVAQAASAAAAN